MHRALASGRWPFRLIVACLAASLIATIAYAAAYMGSGDDAGSQLRASSATELAIRLDDVALDTIRLHRSLRDPDGDVVVTDTETVASDGNVRTSSAPELPTEVSDMLDLADDMASTQSTDTGYAEIRDLAVELAGEATAVLSDAPINGADAVLLAREQAFGHLFDLADEVAIDGSSVGDLTDLTNVLALVEADQALTTLTGEPLDYSIPLTADSESVEAAVRLIGAIDGRLAALAAIPQPGPSADSLIALTVTSLAFIAAATAVVRARRNDEQELAAAQVFEAGLDELTGLLSRSHLVAAFDQARPLGDAGTGVLFLDLDGFKLINDSFGHHAGDEVLKIVTARLLELLRRGDHAIRHGGDEFVLILPEVHDLGEVATVGERAVASISRPMLIDGETLQVGVSVGANLTRDPNADVEELIRDADAALYAAKRSGKSQVVLATGSLTPTSPSRATDQVDRSPSRS